jgi:hypothetical protein
MCNLINDNNTGTFLRFATKMQIQLKNQLSIGVFVLFNESILFSKDLISGSFVAHSGFTNK